MDFILMKVVVWNSFTLRAVVWASSLPLILVEALGIPSFETLSLRTDLLGGVFMYVFFGLHG